MMINDEKMKEVTGGQGPHPGLGPHPGPGWPAHILDIKPGADDAKLLSPDKGQPEDVSVITGKVFLSAGEHPGKGMPTV